MYRLELQLVSGNVCPLGRVIRLVDFSFLVINHQVVSEDAYACVYVRIMSILDEHLLKHSLYLVKLANSQQFQHQSNNVEYLDRAAFLHLFVPLNVSVF